MRSTIQRQVDAKVGKKLLGRIAVCMGEGEGEGDSSKPSLCLANSIGHTCVPV